MRAANGQTADRAALFFAAKIHGDDVGAILDRLHARTIILRRAMGRRLF